MPKKPQADSESNTAKSYASFSFQHQEHSARPALLQVCPLPAERGATAGDTFVSATGHGLLSFGFLVLFLKDPSCYPRSVIGFAVCIPGTFQMPVIVGHLLIPSPRQ